MNIYRKIIILVTGLLLAGITGAQSISDFGVVWKKTYTNFDGNIYNMKPNSMDNNYIAAGGSTNLKKGFVLEVDEQGNYIRYKELDMTTVYTPYNATTAQGTLHFAIKTDDGGILAFGALFDYGAPSSEKATNWTGKDDSANPNLRYGVWLVKLDKNLEIVKNERIRGVRPTNIWRLTNGNIVLGGVDDSATHAAGANDQTTLIRVFNQNGSLLVDNRQDKGGLTSFYQYTGTDNFLMSSSGGIIKGSISSSNILTISSSKTSSEISLQDVTFPYYAGISPTDDNGLFLLSRLHSSTSNVEVIANGYGFYKLDENYNVVFYKKMKPAVDIYFPPLLLNNSNYIGNLSNGGSTYMYQLIDDGTFNSITGITYPSGTSLNLISKTDGFFSVGTESNSPKIAKLSTCVNFITTSLSDLSTIEIFKEAYNTPLNFTKVLNYQGNKGTVTYDLQAVVTSGKVNNTDATDASGGVLYDKTAQTPTSATIATTINDNWTLNTKYAVIEYRFTLHDAYQTAGVNQSCGQTYIFRVAVAPQTDVVAMPTHVKDGTKNIIKTSFKNIGEGSFENYKITIYDSTLGSTTKYTFPYTGLIAPNETVRFNIDLTGTPVANSTNLVVSFNDDGTGTQNQTEQNTKQFTYTIN